MSENITLQVFTPEKMALKRMVYRVQIPYGKMNLTVLEDRAPTSLVLHAGVVSILNAEDNIEKAYFIDGGVADIADNLCKISTGYLIEVSKINHDEALSRRDNEPENKAFYDMIVNYFETMDK